VLIGLLLVELGAKLSQNHQFLQFQNKAQSQESQTLNRRCQVYHHFLRWNRQSSAVATKLMRLRFGEAQVKLSQNPHFLLNQHKQMNLLYQ
jgi:hypothetical protein